MDRKIIVIHFLHGYIVKKQFKHTDKSIRGGLLGGHIYIQLKNHLYGFEPLNIKDFHVLPRIKSSRFNSIVKKGHIDDWLQYHQHVKFTSIEISVSQPRYVYLKNILKKFNKHPPYDYALLGVRCTSFTHYLLTKCGICHSTGIIDSIIRYPYPRKLRSSLMRNAQQQGWKISETAGAEARIWEENIPFLKVLKKKLFS
jgi:hypothetical protein